MAKSFRHGVSEFLGRLLGITPYLATGVPANAQRMPVLKTPPHGLRLLHSADSPAEAELLRQVLIDAGYQIEYVPAIQTGLFGQTGNCDIYVPATEFEEALKFLEQYRNQDAGGRDADGDA